MMKKLIVNLIFVLLLAGVTPAQSKDRFCDTNCKASFAVLGFGSGLDIASSWNQYELNPLARDPKTHLFTPWKGFALKAGLGALTLAGQMEHPRVMAFVRYAAGAFFAGVAVRNWRLEGRR